ncbi:hydroxyacylglutathione hydrolase C-terminal domain-containing protein [Pseudomonas putida]|uniref:hydroxyacylglutathione hydrolase C-terminal domain-containing protein n=1 Tax=Pseudomonas putida TaxID=303 RepID=UPI0018C890D0
MARWRQIFFLSCEKDINPFLRLQDDAIIGRVHTLCGSVNPSPKEVFKALRSLRERW